MKTTIFTALLSLILAGPALAQHQGDPSSTSWKKTIQLDHGKKWTVNSATKEGMEKMLAAVTKASNQKPSPDGKALQAELQAILKTVFQKCDMTGATHDNVHIYLVPLIEKVENLSEQSSAGAVKDSVGQIKAQLLEFGNYFQ